MMKRSAAVAVALALGLVGAGVAMLQAQKAAKMAPASAGQPVHGYTAEVFNGRAQKFTPKKGVDPAKLVGQPIRPGWKN